MGEPSKKNVKNMCLREKLEVLQKIDKGVPKKVIAQMFKITYRIISNIQKNREDIQKLAEFTKIRCHSIRKVRIPRIKLRKPNETVFDSHVLQESDPVQIPFTLTPLYSKAADIRVLNSKTVNGILIAEEIREKIAFSHRNTAEKFVNTFRSLVRENGYSIDNIYNADEAIIHWRTLNSDKDIERKRNREHITALFCTNATATHKLPLLMVEKTPEHEWIEDVNKLPLIFKSQPNSWIDRNIFQEWYENYFIPLVKAEQQTKGCYGKVLLLLDSAPSHPPMEYFNSIDKNFQVLYIPLIISSMIQPLEREVISTIKKFYIDSVKQQILGQIYYEDCEEYLTVFNKIEGCNLLASAWDNISSSMIVRAWEELVDSSIIKTEIKEEHNIEENCHQSDDIHTLLDQNHPNYSVKQECLDLDYSVDQNIDTIMNGHSSSTNQDTIQEYVNVNEDFNIGENSVAVQQAKEALGILYSFIKQEKSHFSHMHMKSLNKIETIINTKCTKMYGYKEENDDEDDVEDVLGT